MRNLLIAILALGIIGGGIGYNMYNKSHDDLNASSADFSVTPKVLFEEFETDETSANTKYLDKTIEVKGIIKSLELSTNSIYLDTGNEMYAIKCEFENSVGLNSYEAGSEVIIRGVCSGLLMDVVLNRCVIIK